MNVVLHLVDFIVSLRSLPGDLRKRSRPENVYDEGSTSVMRKRTSQGCVGNLGSNPQWRASSDVYGVMSSRVYTPVTDERIKGQICFRDFPFLRTE